MVENVTIPARLCRCEAKLKDGSPCQFEWISVGLTKLPSHCANPECRSREWNGKKQRKIPEKKPVIVMPSPVKIRGGFDEEI